MPRDVPRLPIVKFFERRSRRFWTITAVLAATYVAWQGIRATARIVLDRWWLDTVTDSAVWATRTVAQLTLGFGTAAVVAAIVGGSVWWVIRVGKDEHRPRHRLIENYRQRLGPAHNWIMIAIAIFLTWRIGRAAGGQWQLWLLFRHGGSTGVEVPSIGGDLGGYLFRLPFLQAASSFLRQITLVALAVSVWGHMASGALRWLKGPYGSRRLATMHVSVLAALVLILQAIDQIWVARPATAINRIGAFDGPGYTEIHVTRPALVVTALIALIAAVSLLPGAYRRRWRPTLVALCVFALSWLVGVAALPRAVETFVVAPAEAQRQLWSIDHNLTATRDAYDLNRFATTPIALHEGIDAPSFEQAAAISIPLFDPNTLPSALQVLLGTPGTRITNVDTLDYEIDGEHRPVYVAARGSSLADLPERGWVQDHLVYTHGDGAVAILADQTDADGRPNFRQVPSLSGAEHAPLYFAEGYDGWYTIVHTRRAEVDGAVFQGEGIPVGSFGRRLVFSLAQGEYQPMLSSELTSDSLLLYRRSVSQRVRNLAPFLTLDRDPYPIIVGDRVVWAQSGYTTTRTYPYSQFVPSNTPGSLTNLNGVRASILATVDALDGTVHLYRTDVADDPIIEAWDGIFPELFEPASSLPAEVADHVRYPDDMFYVQTLMLGRYHVDSGEALFAGDQRWNVSAAPPKLVGEEATGIADEYDLYPIDDRFAATRTYGPGASNNPNATRNELAGIAIGQHSVDQNLALVIPDDDVILSPNVAQSAIDADPNLAQTVTLLNANGSKVQYGPLAPVIVDDGIVWVRPLIVVGTTAAAVPRLYGLVVVNDGIVGIGPDLSAALEASTTGPK